MDTNKWLWGLDLARLIVLCLLLIVGAYTEITKGKIYNFITVPGLLIGLALAYLIGSVSPLPNSFSLTSSMFGLLAGGGLFFLLYCLGAMGAGDVKMMAAVGAIGGITFTIWAMFFSSLVGGVMALGVLIWHGSLLEGAKDSIRLLFTMRTRDEKKDEPDGEDCGQAAQEKIRTKYTVPYGLAISIGTFAALIFLKGLLN